MGNPTVTPLVESRHDGGFIVSLANGHQSIDEVVLTGAAKILAGTVLGVVTASGKYTPVVEGASDGSQHAAGILYATRDVTSADKPAAVVVRNAEVNGSEIFFPSGATGGQVVTNTAELKALGILVR